MGRFAVRLALTLKGRKLFDAEAAHHSHVYRFETDVLSGGGDWASA